MRKTIGFITGTLSILLISSPVFADTPVNACGDTSGGLFCFTADKLGQVIGRGLSFVFVIGALAALAYLVYGGIKWIMSEGDKTAVETARNQITAAIIGLIIIGLSFLVINIVLSLFGISLSNLTLPTLK